MPEEQKEQKESSPAPVEKKEPQTATIPAAELDSLRQEAAKAAEYLDLAKRAKADFINYQDRVRREKESLAKYSIESFVRDFLPALDSLDLSLRTLEKESEAKKVLEGVKLIEREFVRILAKSEIRPIDAEGKDFDPAFHEAITFEDSTEVAPGKVLGVTRRGWMIHDRVLRPASVRVARKPEDQKNEAST